MRATTARSRSDVTGALISQPSCERLVCFREVGSASGNGGGWVRRDDMGCCYYNGDSAVSFVNFADVAPANPHTHYGHVSCYIPDKPTTTAACGFESCPASAYMHMYSPES